MDIQKIVKIGAILVVIMFGLFEFYAPRRWFPDNVMAGREIVQGTLKMFIYGIILIFSILMFKVEQGLEYYINGFIIVISGIESVCGLELLLSGHKMLKNNKNVNDKNKEE